MVVSWLWRVAAGLEAGFHPHDASSSPLRVSTAHFRDNMHVPLITSAVYVGLIAYGHHYMKTREAWTLKQQLAAWNFSLAAFSMIGAARTTPLLLRKLTTLPLINTICVAPAIDWGAGACGLWVQLFVVSKFAELLDTAFIVLRKRKLIMLHWYHHFTVLVYCWHSYAIEAPHALYFVAMNYCVHTIMYTYYALMSLNINIMPPEIITAAQILQMLVGVAVQLCAMRAKHIRYCYINDYNLLFGALMYASYLALFVNFALKRFVYKKYKRGGAIKDIAGHGEPPSINTVFPVTSAIINRCVTKMRRRMPFSTSSNSLV